MIKNKKSVGSAALPHIPTADEIADMADRGEDISRFFTNRGTMKYPAQQVRIELPDSMAAELDQLAFMLLSLRDFGFDCRSLRLSGFPGE